VNWPVQRKSPTIERRQAFRSNIESLVNELVSRLDGSEGPTGEPPASPGTTAQTAAPAKRDRLTAAVCAECRGFCCGGGNTRAYLRVDTLRKLIERRPDLHLEQLPEVYTECLPERSYSGSCVFHSERGCALPREMRSDTCNDYFCKGQKDLRAAMENGAPARAFVAISDSTQIVAGRFVNAEVEAALAGGGKVS